MKVKEYEQLSNEEKLKYIRNQIYNYSVLFHKKNKMNTNQYKCENWDEFNSSNVEEDLIIQAWKIEDAVNEFISYPKTKFLFIDTTKRVWIKDKKDGVSTMMIDVPFIDKREYYCLIKLLDESNDILSNWTRGTYFFK